MRVELLFFIVLISFLSSVDSAEIRVVHAIPDASAVDVYVDGFKVWDRLIFKSITFYIPLSTDHVNVKVNPTGEIKSLINTNVSISGVTPYTIVAGNVASKIEPFVFVDERRRPEQGKVSVRFVHLSPDVPNVDVVNTANDKVIFDNVEFGKATAYITLDYGVYNLEIRTGGNSVILKVKADFGSDSIYSVFAEGLMKGTGDQALVAIVHSDL
eukprot:TRINITY_DN5541_c0_g1_i1.p1 TRINITY_DN5541_c0_g1~~TRINITY_DN5541_c0_g1_i1.p1  ORF type:complete len:213 (+),score=35.20 TRINITY_DN5541_c0_g1_i1:39-677(+)